MCFYLVKNTEKVLTKRTQGTDTTTKTKHYNISTEICHHHELKKKVVEITKNNAITEEG